MAPRTAMRKERKNDFSAVGKVGRRTGITVPQGRLDANGLEEMSGLFSSPRKPSPLRRQVNALNEISETSRLEVSEEMAGLDSTGLTPTQVLSTRKSLRGNSIPPPRSNSPRKTGIHGTPRRSNGVDVLAIAKDLPFIDPEDRENTPVLTPTRPAQSNVRRFSPSPEKSPLREVTTNGQASSRSAKGKQRAAEERVQIGTDHVVADISKSDGVREAGKGSSQDYDEYVNYATNTDDDQGYIVGGTIHNTEESNLPEDYTEMHESIEVDEEVLSVAPYNSSSRKRKSDSLEIDESESNAPSPPTQPAKKARTCTTKQQSTKSAINSAAKPPLDLELGIEIQPTRKGRLAGKGKASTQPLSTHQESQLGQIIEKVRARPGQQKSLYILRRETPADESAVHTRSGRVSVKPLAYWRNERCVYGGSPGGVNLADGARFPLNSIKEIIRTEEVDHGRSRSPSKGKRKGRKRKRKAQAHTVDHDNDSDSDSEMDEARVDADAEEWETSTGTYHGEVSVWDPMQQAPLDALEEVELAYAPAAIQTKEVKSVHPDQRTFRFAKLLSADYLGAGIVELAPGDLKRPKNSRKMHMCFYVAKGRVTVEVGPLGGEVSRFSVGKGGFWQVPRGNQYSIENELDKSARIFFSQACESAPMVLEE